MREKGKGRRKGKVEMRRIENPIRRQITFSKRKAGLFKKAAELSLLCDVDLALIISSPSGKLYHYPTPNIGRALERYQTIFASSDCGAQDSKNMKLLELEVEKGRKIETKLEEMQKHMIGEDLDCLSFQELQHLEQQMKNSATKIHSRKEMLLRKNIKSLKTKLLELEVEKGRKIETELEEMQKHMIGEDLDCLSFKELQHLEQQMKNSATKIHSRKEMLLRKTIKSLKTKLKMKEDRKYHNSLEGGPINVTIADHQQPQTDGDANGVAMPQTNLQQHTDLSLSLF